MCILETRPGNAVSIIECDMDVDFAPPVGYQEPERKDLKVIAINYLNKSCLICFKLELIFFSLRNQQQRNLKKSQKYIRAID